jgi:elongation of very long chain fatty acids protein 4
MKYYPEYNHFVSWPAMLIPPAIYVVLAVLASRSVTPGKPVLPNSILKNVLRVYNVVQIVLCTYMTIGLLPVVQPPNVFGIDTSMDAAGEWFIFCHYLSKFLDWFDTFFIIVKGNAKKQLSFLHVYHHSSIGLMWGILLMYDNAGGTARYGALINSVTHVFMYSHYLWTSFGRKNPFKALLTKWQICQFYSCFIHAVLVLLGKPIVETHLKLELAWLQFCYHITMVYLFTFKMAWIPRLYIDLEDKSA